MMTLNAQCVSFGKRLLVPMIGALALLAGPLAAQELERFDPGAAPASAPASAAGIDADLVDPRAFDPSAAAPSPAPPLANDLPSLPAAPPLPAPAQASDYGAPAAQPSDLPYGEAAADSAGETSAFDSEFADLDTGSGDETASVQWADPASGVTAGDMTAKEAAQLAEADAKTYGEDDLIGAAEGVFGKGAEGLAKMIEGLLKKEGKPNAYIVGREAGGAFIVGARYGSGTLHHKIEGERKVYWTGPSIGFDAGANAAKTFVLVYNLFDTEDLFKRYPAGEGQAYLIGGLHASYVRRGDVVMIPIRLGAGVRLGVNAGYMKFSKKQRWLPF